MTDERVGSPSSPSVTPAIGATVTDENLTAQRRIDGSSSTVFALLADPANHAAIDGTGWSGAPQGGRPHQRPGRGVRHGDVPPAAPRRRLRDRQPGRHLRAAGRDRVGARVTTSRTGNAPLAAGPGATTSWRSTARPTSPSPTTGQTLRPRHVSASSSRCSASTSSRRPGHPRDAHDLTSHEGEPVQRMQMTHNCRSDVAALHNGQEDRPLGYDFSGQIS